MMKSRLFLGTTLCCLIVLCATFLAIPALAQREDSIQSCAHASGDMQIKACTWLIRNGKQCGPGPSPTMNETVQVSRAT